MPPPPGLIETITRAISDRGEVLDSASPKLASIRSEMRVAHERLLGKLERLINDPKNAPILQEQIITQRNGRYVIPLRADFKGRIRSMNRSPRASDLRRISAMSASSIRSTPTSSADRPSTSSGAA